MLYLDDKLPHHPKIFQAGRHLGGVDGAALALAMFVEGLAYSCAQMTDGFIPISVVENSPLTKRPLTVAKSLVAVSLWESLPDGFKIHDFHDWNKSAAERKKIQRKWREKKRRQRRGGNGEFSAAQAVVPCPQKVSGGHLSHQDFYRDSRARTRSTYHNHEVRTLPRSNDPGSCTAGVLTARFARGISTGHENRKKQPTHRELCAMVRDEQRTSTSFSDCVEGVKVRLARQGFAYPDGRRLAVAFEAVDVTRRRKTA